MKFKRNKIYLKIGIAILILFALFLNISFTEQNNEWDQNINEKNLNSAKSWTFKSIYIDNYTSNSPDGTPNGTWSWAKSQPWCEGKGTWEDPFIIENITIENDFSSSGIQIRDSDIPFIIRNCTIYETGTGVSFDAGIKLWNVTHGLLEINNCTNNDGDGILFYDCENITVSRNNIEEHGDYTKNGIMVYNSFNNTIIDNNVTLNVRGIFLSNSNNNTVLENNASDNNQDGIAVWDGDKNIVKNNIVNSHTFYGINLINAKNNTIFNNTASENQRGIYLEESDKNIIKYNNISKHTGGSGRGIRLYKSDFNEIFYNNFTDNYYGLHLAESVNNSIGKNTIDGGDWGLYLHVSTNNSIGENTIKNNFRGISIQGSSKNNSIWNNKIFDNDNYGIYIYLYCPNNEILNNEIENSNIGIQIGSNSNKTKVISNSITQCGTYGIEIINSSNQLCYDTLVYENVFNNPGAKNAQDNGTNTKWDNGTIGNYWHDYSGTDLNDNGIGDTPYIVDLFRGIVDNYPIWSDTDDIAPKITIYSPSDNSLFTKSEEPPDFNVQVIDQSLDTKWYTMDSGNTNFTFMSDQGIINDTAWENMPDGNITITFYANDSISRVSSKSVKILKDTKAPSITVNSPLENTTINATAPEFSLTISDPLLDMCWYTINDGTKIYNFTGSKIQIDQREWDNLPDGFVNITFHANDTLSRFCDFTIKVIKDTVLPQLNFKGTSINGTTTQNTPNFTITITEKYLDSVWVKIFEKGTNQTYIQEINISDMLNVAANSDSYEIPIQIDETTWNSFHDGEIELIVYANDTAGNTGSMNILVNKGNAPGSNIPFGDVYIIIVFIGVVSTILIIKTKKEKSNL